MKPNIKHLSFTEFEAYLYERKQPAYRAKQIWQWLYQRRAVSFTEMTNLAASFREQLAEDFVISRLAIRRKSVSSDGTTKILFGLDDGHSIESVLIPEVKRQTLCISTQAGCGLGCSFCATALLGLQRNLHASEIVDQIIEASRLLTDQRRITHIVLMGMGEPLANYEQTIRALKVMTDPSWGLGISSRRITLSSVGLVPQIKKLIAETDVNLAISLHAADDALRTELMPINRKYNLQQLIDCCRSLPIPRRKRITFEYVLLRGINASAADAHRLGDLLRGLRCKINIIPFNPHAGSPFKRPNDEEIAQFQQILYGRGLQVNVRRPRGDDIQAACGQLQGEESMKLSNPETLAVAGF
jgi:23S rRNA (adenine2503-C2)-methyltransferase